MTIHIVVCYINLIFRCQNIKKKIDVEELFIEKKIVNLKKGNISSRSSLAAPLTDYHVYPKPDGHVVRDI